MKVSIPLFCSLLFATLLPLDIVGAADLPTGATICNVKDFGAIGDGVADDTVPVQAAMKNCAIVGGQNAVMFFPFGIYKLYSSTASTFEFAFFFQSCTNATDNAVSFLGEDDGAGSRALIKWVVTTTTKAFLFSVTTCANFGVSNLNVLVYAQEPQTVVASVQNSVGVTISDVHWMAESDSPIGYATDLSLQSVTNSVIQNAIFEDSHSVAVILVECTNAVFLHTTINGDVSSNTTYAIGVQGGSNFQFDDLSVSNTLDGIDFWSELKPDAIGASISHSTFDVTSQAITIRNDLTINVTGTVFRNSNTPAALYGISFIENINPCITIGNSTFSKFGGAAIQNVYDSAYRSGALKQHKHARGSVKKNSDCDLLVIEQTAFEFNQMDLDIQGSDWNIVNNFCVGNAASLLTCLGNNCDESNNQGCNFNQPPQSIVRSDPERALTSKPEDNLSIVQACAPRGKLWV